MSDDTICPSICLNTVLEEEEMCYEQISRVFISTVNPLLSIQTSGHLESHDPVIAMRAGCIV